MEATISHRKENHLRVRCTAPVVSALRDLAHQQNTTVSALTRRLIREELRRNGVTIVVNLKLV